ncbi:MAG TPA: hypothetical protein VIA98_11175 [Allosphingosinicella sp.]|jgi:hypothetical protein
MNMISAISDCGCDALVEGLRAEFGAVLAERIVEAEAVDFLWEGRVRERYLGEHVAAFADEETPEDISRIAVLSVIDGRWYTGLCLVDAEGDAIELLWKRELGSRNEAEIALERAR